MIEYIKLNTVTVLPNNVFIWQGITSCQRDFSAFCRASGLVYALECTPECTLLDENTIGALVGRAQHLYNLNDYVPFKFDKKIYRRM